MTSSSGQIEKARSVLEVVAIVRDALATWSPSEIALLPERVRPGRIRDDVDVDELHAKLVDEYRTTRATGPEMSALQTLTGLLVRATVRIAELRESAATGGSTAPSSGPMKAAARRG
jgi:hypothetical protein